MNKTGLPFFEAGKPFFGEITATRLNSIVGALQGATIRPSKGMRTTETASGTTAVPIVRRTKPSVPPPFWVSLVAAEEYGKSSITVVDGVVVKMDRSAPSDWIHPDNVKDVDGNPTVFEIEKNQAIYCIHDLIDDGVTLHVDDDHKEGLNGTEIWHKLAVLEDNPAGDLALTMHQAGSHIVYDPYAGGLDLDIDIYEVTLEYETGTMIAETDATVTGTAGGHDHAFSIEESGAHAHAVSISSGGAHYHALESHDHTAYGNTVTTTSQVPPGTPNSGIQLSRTGTYTALTTTWTDDGEHVHGEDDFQWATGGDGEHTHEGTTDATAGHEHGIPALTLTFTGDAPITSLAYAKSTDFWRLSWRKGRLTGVTFNGVNAPTLPFGGISLEICSFVGASDVTPT